MSKRYKSGLEIKRSIINTLRNRSISLRKLETKLNIGYNPIKLHCKELEFLGVVNIFKTKKDSRNGRPYSIVELSEYGKSLAQ